MSISVKAQGIGYSKTFRLRNEGTAADLTAKLTEDQGGSAWEVYKGGSKLGSTAVLNDGETYIVVKQNTKVTLGKKK